MNRFYAPDHSATAQILTDVAEHLAAEGADVTVIASRAIYGQETGLLPRRETLNGVKVVRVATPARRAGMTGRVMAYLCYYGAGFFAALRHARRGSIIIAKTDPPLLSVPAILAAVTKRARLVQWVQDLYPEIAGAYGIRLATGPLGSALSMLRNWSFRNSDRVVAIGNIMAERMIAIGVDARRIATIQNWTNDVSIVPRADRSPELREQWGIAPNDFVLAYSGNLGRAHEIDTLLGAARALRDRDDIRFLFIGAGHMLDELSSRVQQEKLTSFVFAPYQPREKLSESLGLADAHWVSLRPEFEGLIVPSKVFGICAAARPVIAVCAADGEIPRILPPGKACINVAPGDSAALAKALTSLADDRQAGDQLGREARMLLDTRYAKAHALTAWRNLLWQIGQPDRTAER